jgi:hypothetical protein
MMPDQNGCAARNPTFTIALAIATRTPTIRAHSWPANTAIPAPATMAPPMMCTQPQTV